MKYIFGGKRSARESFIFQNCLGLHNLKPTSNFLFWTDFKLIEKLQKYYREIPFTLLFLMPTSYIIILQWSETGINTGIILSQLQTLLEFYLFSHWCPFFCFNIWSSIPFCIWYAFSCFFQFLSLIFQHFDAFEGHRSVILLHVPLHFFCLMFSHY